MLSPAAKSSTGEHFAHAQLPVAKPDITWYSRAHETTRKGRRYEKGSRPTDIGSANAEPYTGTILEPLSTNRVSTAAATERDHHHVRRQLRVKGGRLPSGLPPGQIVL
jgi:hypothetical protein